MCSTEALLALERMFVEGFEETHITPLSQDKTI